MTLRKILFLLAVVLLAGAYMYRERELEMEELRRIAQKNLPENLLPKFDRKLIKRISVISPKGRYTLVHPVGKSDPVPGKQELDWVLAQPMGAALSSKKLEQIISALTLLNSQKTIVAEEVFEDEDYGLEPPAMTVVMVGEDVPRAITVGKLHPLTQRRYAQLEGDPRRFMVEAAFFDSLNQSPDEIRDRMPLFWDFKDLIQVLMLSPVSGVAQFSRDSGTSPWSAKTPTGDIQVDQIALERTLAEFQRAEVVEYVDDAEDIIDTFGLRRPTLTLKFHWGKTEPLVSDRIVEIAEVRGLAGPEVYFRLQGSKTINKVARPFYRDFLRPLEFFRDRTPFSEFSLGDFSNYSFDLPSGRSASLSRDDKNHEAMADAFADFLRTFEVISFEPLTEELQRQADLEHPWSQVQFRVKDKVGKIRFGKPIEESSQHSADSAQMPRWAAIDVGDGILRSAYVGSDRLKPYVTVIEFLEKQANPS